MRWIGQATLCIGVMLAVASIASAQAPEDRQHARAEFDRGVQLYTQGNYQSALEAFQEAYRLAPHPTVRVNMANCYDHLNKPVEAIFHFEHYLTEAGHGAPAAQRHDVESALERLHERVGLLSLHVAPDGARVTIDGNDERRAPVLEPVTLTAGTHNLETVLAGYTNDRRTVEVPGSGHTAEVTIRLERPGAGGAQIAQGGNTGTGGGGSHTTTTTTTGTGTTGTGTTGTGTTGTGTIATSTGTTTTTTNTSETGTGLDNGSGTGTGETGGGTGETGGGTGETYTPPPSGGGTFQLGVATIITGSVSAALLVAAVISGIISISANSAFNQDVITCNDFSASNRLDGCNDGITQAATASSAANWADGLGVAAAIGAGATVALLLLVDSHAGHSDQAPPVALLPSVSPYGGSLTLHGSF